MNEVAYYDFIMRITAAICATLLVVAVLYFINRNKVAKQQTLQKLVESGKEITPQLLESLDLVTKKQPQSDFRRGMLLLVTGIVLTLTFMTMGVIAWVFGLLPIIIGLVYIGFSRMKAAKK